MNMPVRRRAVRGAARDINDDPDEPPPIPIRSGENGPLLYEIERVLDWQMTRHGMQYLVRWKGYSSSQDSWTPDVPSHFMESVAALLEKDGQKVETSDPKPKKGPRTNIEDVYYRNKNQASRNNVKERFYEDEPSFDMILEPTARQGEDDDEDEIPRGDGDPPGIDDPFSQKVKERERHVQLKMACIDNQCMICGWPYRTAYMHQEYSIHASR